MDHSFNHPGGATQLRVAIYTRFSCSMQRPASLEDQERNCRGYAEQKGWQVMEDFVRFDAAQTGRKLSTRKALNALLGEARERDRGFDVLIVDEPSRLGRKLSHVLDIVDRLTFNRVKVVFVNKKLESSDPQFRFVFPILASMDEESSADARYRVLRGQEGCARKGYSTGSRCFGYRSVVVPDPEKPDSQTRADMLGTKWVVVESEAQTVRYVHQLFGDGLSSYEICLRLNREKVPAARKPRIGNCGTVWNANLIKRLLTNEKYIGQIIWNKTHQVIDPETEKTVTRENPPETWIRANRPSLRIVSDEVWARTQERLGIVNKKMTARRIGGLNRAKRRDYLFSGLLTCGQCGSSMIIGSSHQDHRSASYGCTSARYLRGCTNRLWIREDRLSLQLVNALSQNLLVPEVMEYLVSCVSKELDIYLKGASRTHEGSRQNLEQRKSDLELTSRRVVDMLTRATPESEKALLGRLHEVEVEKNQLESALQLLDIPRALASPGQNLAEVVRTHVANLLEVIKQDVPKARQVLQKHITSLRLYPVDLPEGPGYEVQGEIDLFVAPQDPKKRVLLDRSLKGTIQQYTDHVYRFAGLMVVAKPASHPEPLEAQLEALLTSDVSLLHKPLTPGEWTELLRATLVGDAVALKRCDFRHLAAQFTDRAAIYRERFGMVEIAHGRKNWYMFSASGLRSGVNDHDIITSVAA